jgi:hypothetical protein
MLEARRSGDERVETVEVEDAVAKLNLLKKR